MQNERKMQSNGAENVGRERRKRKCVRLTGKILGSSIIISFIGIICFAVLLAAMLLIKF